MVKEAKLAQVDALAKKLDSTNVIGLLDMHKLPSKQYQEIQKQIRDNVEVAMVKKSVLLHAIEKSKKEKIKEFAEKIPEQPALVFTNLDPFKFYIAVSRLRSPNYAKESDVAESEIEVTAGPTDLMPGPAINEFSKLGIPAGVEGGKIAVKRDKVVAKKGDVISKDLASVLRKLKIQPVSVGLNVVAVYDGGTIYLKDVLSLAGQVYIDQTLLAHQHAINLSVGIGYPTKENIGMILAKAQRQAQALESKAKVPEAPVEKKEEQKQEEKEEKTEIPKSEETQTQVSSQEGGKS